MKKEVTTMELIESFVMQDRDHHKKSSHWPSEAKSCVRQLYYKWTEETKSNLPNFPTKIKWKFGNYAETGIIEEALMQAEQDGTIKQFMHHTKYKYKHPSLEHEISGEFDFLVENLDDEWYILEAKSAFGRGMTNCKNEAKPHDGYIAQAAIYLYFCQKIEELKHIKYVYMPVLARDNGYMLEFRLYEHEDGRFLCDQIHKGEVIHTTPIYDGESEHCNFRHYIGNILQRFAAVETYLKLGKVPSREYKLAIRDGEAKDKFQKNNVVYKSDWQCNNYCDYRDTCYQIDPLDKTDYYGGKEV